MSPCAQHLLRTEEYVVPLLFIVLFAASWTSVADIKEAVHEERMARKSAEAETVFHRQALTVDRVLTAVDWMRGAEAWLCWGFACSL